MTQLHESQGQIDHCCCRDAGGIRRCGHNARRHRENAVQKTDTPRRAASQNAGLSLRGRGGRDSPPFVPSAIHRDADHHKNYPRETMTRAEFRMLGVHTKKGA